MSGTKKIDYLIVGQGLAGSALALQLLVRRKTVLVMDMPRANASSAVAAGLFNPVTGRKMSKTWLAEKLFSHLASFYTHAERVTQGRFFYPVPIYRPFISAQEQNEWMAGSADAGLAPFVQQVHAQPCYPAFVHDHFGGILLAQSGYLDTRGYMEAVRTWLAGLGAYCEEDFQEEALVVHNDKVVYGDLTAQKLIFCQGESVLRSRFFNWLPIRPLKGETITIEGEFSEDVIFNRGVYIVPSGRFTWKVGATYQHTFNSRDSTPAGREELVAKLRELTPRPFAVTGQEAGIRPTTPDRRPMLGAHPAHENIAIFNGLGTKGVSLAPYFSDVLVRWLENSGVIDKEVDISRYKSLYWNSR